MADVDNGDILRLGAGLSFEGIYDVVNVWHVIANLDAGEDWATMIPEIQDYVDGLYASLKTPLNDTMGTNVISVANVTQDTTLGAIPWLPTWAGAEGSDQLAPGVCCFAWARTYKPRVQIRKYFGVWGEAQLSQGTWITAVETGVEAVMAYHIANQVTSTGIAFQGIAYNRALTTFEYGVSVASSREPAYQRRRTRGRGS